MALRAEEKRGINVRDEFIDYAAPSNSFGDEGLLIKAKQRKDDFRKDGVDPASVKSKMHFLL